MLLRGHDGEVIAITQPAHAWLSGLMARDWGNEHFAAPAPRFDVCLAAGLHDIGWLGWEEATHFDPATGLPRVFADVPAEEHTVLWSRGVRHVNAYSTYAALLVSTHGDTIYEKTFDASTARPAAAAAVRAFLDEQHAFQRDAVARLRRDPRWLVPTSDDHLRGHKRLLAAVDTMSLNLCWGLAKRVVVADVPTSPTQTIAVALEPDGPTRVRVDPWPFAVDSLPLAWEGRRLPGPVRDEGALAAALARSDVVRLEVELRPVHPRAR